MLIVSRSVISGPLGILIDTNMELHKINGSNDRFPHRARLHLGFLSMTHSITLASLLKRMRQEFSYHLPRNTGTYLGPACSSLSSSEYFFNLFSLSENLLPLKEKTDLKSKETGKTFLLSLPSSNCSSQCFSQTHFRTRNDRQLLYEKCGTSSSLADFFSRIA